MSVFDETAPYLDSLGAVTCTVSGSSQTFKALVETTNVIQQDHAGKSYVSSNTFLTVATTDANTLSTDEVVTVKGTNYKVREVMAIEDGTFSTIHVTKA